MKKAILCMIAASSLLGACATAETASESTAGSASRSAKEDFLTGSRLPRSEFNENFQGAKSMTRQDYQEYKASTGLKGARGD